VAQGGRLRVTWPGRKLSAKQQRATNYTEMFSSKNLGQTCVHRWGFFLECGEGGGFPELCGAQQGILACCPVACGWILRHTACDFDVSKPPTHNHTQANSSGRINSDIRIFSQSFLNSTILKKGVLRLYT